MPNFRERTRLRRARIAAGNVPGPPPAPRPRPIVPQPSFAEWPVNLPAPPPTEGEVAVIETTSAEVTVAELEAMTYNDLRAFLKESDLSAAGTKVDLLIRAIEFAEEPIE